MIEKAQESVAAAEDVTAVVEEVMVEETKPLPTVIIEDDPVEPEPTEVEPSMEFQDWVSAARISGVREGQSPRAFINSILVRQGDTIDLQLGIVFQGVDANRNLVILRDASGAVVGKKY
ncbi:MAG: hypothetical protein J6386_14905 [Candidatus Synoicihabitans palmerolidicus]|nr:hypothetical protein [Candidatus Synoicihabitans palmerolidicus]